ncbi:hypothetical protein ACM614_29075 [Streptomyces sp. 12297]
MHTRNALTHLGDSRRVGEEQRRALELYAADDTNRAFARLDTAMCVTVEGDVARAACWPRTLSAACRSRKLR